MVGFRVHGTLRESWWGTTTPPTGPVGTATTWTGATFQTTVAGRIMGVRCYRGSDQNNATSVYIWEWGTFTLLRAFQFRDVAYTGWQQAWFHPVLRVASGISYRVAVLQDGGGLFRQNTALAGGPVTHNHIKMMASWQTTSLALFRAVSWTDNTNANAIDILFLPD